MPTKVTYTDITPGSTGWQAVDITAYVGSDAGSVAAAHLRMEVAGTGGDSFGARMTGSADATVGTGISPKYSDITIGVDSDDTFEVNVSNTTNVIVWLMGYSTTAEAEAIDPDGWEFTGTLSEATWGEIDPDAQFTGTPEAVFGTIYLTGNDFDYGTWGIRPSDSADTVLATQGPRTGDNSHQWFAMVCASGTFDFYTTSLTAREAIINVALIDGVTHGATRSSWNSGSDSTWNTRDLTADGNINAGDAWLFSITAITSFGTNSSSGLRATGDTTADQISNAYTDVVHHGFTPMAAGDQVDVYVQDNGATPTRIFHYVYGSAAATPAGGAVEVALTGSQPASTGALSVLQVKDFVTGSQPASTGALTAVQTLARSLTGSQPASTGTVTGKYLIALTGSQPASTGTVSAQQTLAIALAGSQPASTGAVAVKYAIALTGSQPASTGALSAAVAGAVALTGDQPASTGSLTAVQTLAISLAGNQPASTGSLSVNTGTQVSLTGSQPASTGTLSVQQTLFVSLTGAQPSSTGVLSAIQTLAVALVGSQPQSTGVLQAVASYFVLLAGNQPASTGVLTSDAVAESTRVIALTGRWDPVIAMTGRYDPTITMTGRWDPTITLTGQS